MPEIPIEYHGFIGVIIGAVITGIISYLISIKSISSQEKIVSKTIHHQLVTENHRLRYEFLTQIYIANSKHLIEIYKRIGNDTGSMSAEQYTTIDALLSDFEANMIATGDKYLEQLAMLSGVELELKIQEMNNSELSRYSQRALAKWDNASYAQMHLAKLIGGLTLDNNETHQDK